MVSYSVVSSTAGAMSYYEQGKGDGKGEYYAKEEAPSTWGGKGAELAGLEPGSKVDPKTFEDLLNGKLPNQVTGEIQQMGRVDADGNNTHRPGIDFTLSASKSISLVALVGGDDRIFAVDDAAVSRSMAYLESLVEVRVKHDGGEVEYRKTGNLAHASFRHGTSRADDPQMHTHNVVLNSSWDEESGKWRAIEPDSMIKALKVADAIYKNELARGLRDLGYNIRNDKNGPEIDGISRDQVEKFSKRLEAIDNELAAQGKTRGTASAEQRDVAALKTRDRKSHPEKETLKEKWSAEAEAVGLKLASLIDRAKAKSGTEAKLAVADPALTLATKTRNVEKEAANAVAKASAHLSERHGTTISELGR